MNYWTSTNYSHLSPETAELFRLLDPRIRRLMGTEVSSKATRYIAYKALEMRHAFVRLIPNKKGRLVVRLGMPLVQIIDSRGLCREGTASRWSVVHANVDFDSVDRINDIMALIEQTYHYNLA